MKNLKKLTINLLLVFVLLSGSLFSAAGQTDAAEEYISVHTAEELHNFFSLITSYMNKKGEELLADLDDTEEQIVNNALVRSWAIVMYDDATPQQIDDAYDALFNMSLFLGLASDPTESFSTGLLFEYAVQLLDQEYFDLLTEAGEDPETIEYAQYLRDIAEALVEDPESFTAGEVENWVFEIYAESYMASGLKAIAHTEALPLPEELFPEEQEDVLMPNPIVTYDSSEPLNEMLGISMPGMPKDLNAEADYFSIIADIIAESKYDLPEGAMVVLRLSPETEADITGVYGSSFFEEWEVAGTKVEIFKYQSIFIASGVVKTADEAEYGFAIDAEGVSEDTFRAIVTFFIEDCRNQRSR